jgi:hypothetical protein
MALAAAFVDWDGDVKCEFKYHRDLSKANVRTINVSGKVMILDDATRIQLPD